MANLQSAPGNPTEGAALIDKAERLLGWTRAWLAEFRDHAQEARMGDVVRVLHAMLAAWSEAHEALLDATWHLRARQLRAELLELHRTDPLLSYLGKALGDEARGPIVAWDARGRGAEVVVVDPSRAGAWLLLRDPLYPGREFEFLLRYLFGVASADAFVRRFEADPSPIDSRLLAAGVRLRHAPDAVSFAPFESRDANGQPVRVGVPSHHLGQPLTPAAHVGLEKVIVFYEARIRTARALVPAPRGKVF